MKTWIERMKNSFQQINKNIEIVTTNSSKNINSEIG